MAVLPTLEVAVAWQQGPLVDPAALVWTVLGEPRTLDVESTRRAVEIDRYGAGRLEAGMPNDDGALDPWAHPTVQALSTVRVRIDDHDGAGWRPHGWGYIDAIEPSWSSPVTDTATLRCTDAFAYLAGKKIATVGYDAAVVTRGPSAYYRLNDLERSSTARETIGGGTAKVDVPGFGAGPLLVGDPARSVDFGDPDANIAEGTEGIGGVFLPAAVVTGATSFSLEFMVQMPEGGYGGVIFWQGAGGGPIVTVDTETIFDDGGEWVGQQIRAYAQGGTTYAEAHTADYLLNDGEPHHVVVTVDQATGEIRLYVDGAYNVDRQLNPPIAPNSPLGTFTPAAGGWATIGSSGVRGQPSISTNFRGRLQEFAVYQRVLTPAEAAASASLALTPWAGDTADVRVGRILDKVGWPAALRRISAGISRLQAEDDSIIGANVLEYLQLVVESDGGRLYIDPDGALVVTSRTAALARVGAVPVATFSDVDPTTGAFPAGAIGYGPGALAAGMAVAALGNVATVTRRGGAPQTSRNATSVALYDAERDVALDGQLLATDADALRRAQWVTSRHAVAEQRVRSVTIDGRLGSARAYKLAALRIGDLVRVLHHPAGGGLYSELCRIEGITSRAGGRVLTWTLQLIGAERDDDYLLMGNDASAFMGRPMAW